jgi:mannosyltransferase OCH1-like enzyme
MTALIEKYSIENKVNQFVDSMTFDDLPFTSGVNEYLTINKCETWQSGLNTLADNDLIMQRGAIDSRLNTI